MDHFRKNEKVCVVNREIDLGIKPKTAQFIYSTYLQNTATSVRAINLWDDNTEIIYRQQKQCVDCKLNYFKRLMRV